MAGMSDSGFPYRQADYEPVPCNLCLGADLEILARMDRNGLPVQTVLCRRCGLIFISPRMTAKWYDLYYQKEYREQMARFKGQPVREPDFDLLFEGAAKHGAALARRCAADCAAGRDENDKGLAIEVGSSVGGVLHGFRSVLGGEVIGIEPSPGESAYAQQRGISTHTASIESFKAILPPASIILCCQSLNHFLDPAFFLKWSHQHLRPGGTLILEVMNFRQVFADFRWMPRAIQIDHTYMFVPEVLRNFVEAAGFEVLRLDARENPNKADRTAAKKEGLPIYHATLIARKTSREPFVQRDSIPNLYGAVRDSLRKIPSSQFRYFLRLGPRKWLKQKKMRAL